MRLALLMLAATAGLVSGCTRDPLQVTRSSCPAIAVLQNTGTQTLFRPATSRDASAIDVTATITDLRGTCTEAGDQLLAPVSFTVLAHRRDASGPRAVALPFFAAVVQAGDRLIAKQTGIVTLQFGAGEARARAPATAQVQIARAAALLPPEIEERITRERKPGDPDAAIDPMSEREVRDAVRAATFEVLVGFQLDEASLAYNVTR